MSVWLFAGRRRVELTPPGRLGQAQLQPKLCARRWDAAAVFVSKVHHEFSSHFLILLLLCPARRSPAGRKDVLRIAELAVQFA